MILFQPLAQEVTPGSATHDHGEDDGENKTEAELEIHCDTKLDDLKGAVAAVPMPLAGPGDARGSGFVEVDGGAAASESLQPKEPHVKVEPPAEQNEPHPFLDAMALVPVPQATLLDGVDTMRLDEQLDQTEQSHQQEPETQLVPSQTLSECLGAFVQADLNLSQGETLMHAAADDAADDVADEVPYQNAEKSRVNDTMPELSLSSQPNETPNHAERNKVDDTIPNQTITPEPTIPRADRADHNMTGAGDDDGASDDVGAGGSNNGTSGQLRSDVTSSPSAPDGLQGTSDINTEKAAKPQSEPKTTVRSLKEAFEFWDFCFDVLCHGKDEEESQEVLESLASELREDSMSTAFSGVGAPETAKAVLLNRLGNRLGRELSVNQHAARIQHSIEWFTPSTEECKLTADLHDSCVFSDIGQFYRPELLEDTIPSLLAKPAMAFQVLMPLIMSNRAVCTKGWCVRHQKYCSLKTNKRHTAGTSCRGYSRRGAQLGNTDTDVIYSLCWCALRRTLQESDITQENVESFPIRFIADLLEDMYHLTAITLDASNFGTPCNRRRQFIRLRHRSKILAEISPLADFCKRFFRMAAFHWKECFGSIQHDHIFPPPNRLHPPDALSDDEI